MKQPQVPKRSERNEAPDTTGPDGQTKQRRRIPRFAKIIVILLVAGAAVWWGVNNIPDYVARYVVNSELKDMVIDVEGAKTIDLRPWQSEIWLGPVGVRPLDSDVKPAIVQRLGVTYDITNIFKRRALVSEMVIDGIDVEIERAADGNITINGVDLSDFAPKEEDQAEETSEADDGGGWGTGLETFELRNSRVFMNDLARGEATLQIDRLALRDFRSWQPDDAGTYEIAASLNDIDFVAEGEARPFAEDISLTLNGRVTRGAFENIATYLGPAFGFERRGGTFTATFSKELTLFANGRLEIQTNASVEAADADGARPDGIEGSFQHADYDIEITTVLDEAGNIHVQGEIDNDYKGFKFKFPDGLTLDIGVIETKYTDLDVKLQSDGALVFDVKPTYTAKGVKIGGPIDLSYDSLKLDLTTLNVRIADDKFLVTSGGSTELQGVTLAGPADATLANMKIGLSDMNAEMVGENLSVTAAGTSSALQDLRISGPAEASLASVEFNLSALNAELDGESFALKSSGSTALETIEVTDPITAEIGNLSIGFSDFNVEKAGENLSVSGSSVSEMQSLKTELPEQPGQPKITAAVESLNLTLSELAALIAAGAPQWQMGIDAEVGGLSAAIGKNLATAKARQVTLKGAQTDQSLSLAADDLVISNLQADLSDKLAAAFDGGEKKAPAGEPTSTVKLGRLALVNGSTIRYRDTSVEPNVDITVTANPLELKNVDTGNPNQRTDVKLGGIVNEFAKLDVSGWAEPLAGKPTFDLSANVQGLQLPAFSPYAADAIGMYLDAGTLSTNAKGAANQGKLKANVKMQLSNLKLSPLSPADAERLSAQVGVPVETAVSLLKDADGTIRLELPISGTTDSPDIDLSQVIGKAIGGAFGSLFASTDSKGGVAFNPIAFKPGSTQLEQDGINIARGLADMMQKRPQMTVNVCGRATAQDLSAYASQKGLELPKALPPADAGSQAAPANDPEELEQIETDMNKLATERTHAVRRFMTSGLGIAEGRVAECRPVFDQADTGAPRVEISL